MLSVRSLFIRFLSVAFGALLVALPLQIVSAANKLDVLDKGPAIGAPLPHQLTVADQFNQIRDFAGLNRHTGLILLFYRSFDW